MATFTVRKLIRYSVDVVVEADSEDDAIEKAKLKDGDAYFDDTLIDIYVISSEGD